MRHYSEERGFHQEGYCGEESKNCPHLHCHHIKPHRTNNGASENPRNLITLSSCEHNGICPSRKIRGGLKGGKYTDDRKHFTVHPDIRDATMNYKGSGNVFQEVFKKREEKLKRGEKYWNTDHDVEMKQTARERSITGLWKFPSVRRRKKK